jgi:acyl transferase domain-containing protein
MLIEADNRTLAGIRKEDIDGSDAAVYIGSFVKGKNVQSFGKILLTLVDYEQVCLRDPDWQPQYAATGNGIAIMANRISYFFNLHGPSMTIDTGCSGSLVSVHLASQSLRARETSLVGVSQPFQFVDADKYAGDCRWGWYDSYTQYYDAYDSS